MTTRYPLLNNKAWLEEIYSTLSTAEIAAQLGCSTVWVVKALHANGIPIRSNTIDILQDAERLRQAYATMSSAEMAAQFGCSTSAIWRALQRHGIPPKHRMVPQLYDAEWLRTAYATQTCAQIAEQLGSRPEAVRLALEKLGIERRQRIFRFPQLDDPAWLAAQYQTHTYKQIAASLGCSPAWIIRALRKYNVASRPHGPLPKAFGLDAEAWISLQEELGRRYQAGESLQKIGETYQVNHQTIANRLEKRGIIRRTRSEAGRTHTIDETVFDEPLTEAAAYFLGFLMADGHVGRGIRKNVISVGLAPKDADHVQWFKDFLKASHPIRVRRDGQCYILVVHSPKLVERLKRFGIVPGKSFAGYFAGLEWNRHAWRGLMDGDGSLYVSRDHKIPRWYPAFHLVGAPRLLEQFAEFVRFHIPACRIHPRETSHCPGLFEIGTKGKYARTLIELLYSDCTIALPRKLHIARSVLQDQLPMIF